METGAISTASPGRESSSNALSVTPFMSFPILWTYAFSRGPVAGAKPPKMDGPPGGAHLNRFGAVKSGPKMGKHAALDRNW